MTSQTANPWESQDSSEAAVAAVAAVAAAAEAAVAAVAAVASKAAVAPEIPDANRPNPPSIEYPSEGQKLQKGGQLLTGRCENGARVEVLNSNDTHLAWATVKGNWWFYYRDWYVGPKHVKVAQTVGAWYSYPSRLRTFTVIEQVDEPMVVAPGINSSHQPGLVQIVVGSDPAASAVRVLSWDDSVLGDAVQLMPGVWGLDFYWNSGTKHVKAEQVVNGKVSSRSSVIQFYIS